MSIIYHGDSYVQGPLPNKNIPHGSIVRVTASATHSLGDCLVLIPAGSPATSYATLDADACETYSVAVPSETDHSTDIAAGLMARIHGILLQDMVSGGVGWAMVRGLCMANVESVTDTIALNDALYAGESAAGASGHTLANSTDVTAADNCRILAFSRFNGTAVAATVATLIPVLFNGVEGFFSFEGTA